ncbi:hypothetical protein [Arthrobacter cupressi]|uniref:hypothetical protein n=1 Tax=Arthrobacter cupressi TaxID=1045773 RepID=UPI0015874004|nr:hypothetical protein [Arthrobacter cupressi]NYD77624.1 hypothetical protein [Arthrobacter cupressi]
MTLGLSAPSKRHGPQFRSYEPGYGQGVASLKSRPSAMSWRRRWTTLPERFD